MNISKFQIQPEFLTYSLCHYKYMQKLNEKFKKFELSSFKTRFKIEFLSPSTGFFIEL